MGILVIAMFLAIILIVSTAIVFTSTPFNEDSRDDRDLRVIFHVSLAIFAIIALTLLFTKTDDISDYYEHLQTSEILEEQIENWDELGKYEKVLVSVDIIEFNEIIQNEREIKNNFFTRGFHNELIARMDKIELPFEEGD